MANELLNLQAPSGLDICAEVWYNGMVWNTNASSLVLPGTISDANWPSYIPVTVTEKLTGSGTGTGRYVGNLPATGMSGKHEVNFHDTLTPEPGRLRYGYQEVDSRDYSTVLLRTTISSNDMGTGIQIALDDGPSNDDALEECVAVVIGGNEMSTRRIDNYDEEGVTGDPTITLDSAIDFTPQAGDEVLIQAAFTVSAEDIADAIISRTTRAHYNKTGVRPGYDSLYGAILAMVNSRTEDDYIKIYNIVDGGEDTLLHSIAIETAADGVFITGVGVN